MLVGWRGDRMHVGQRGGWLVGGKGPRAIEGTIGLVWRKVSDTMAKRAVRVIRGGRIT